MRVWTNKQISQIYQDESIVINFIEDLPVDTDTRYTKELIRLVVNNPPALKETLYHILDSHINDNNKNIAFSAFYGLVVYFRRYKFFSELEKLVDRYGDNFNNKPLFNIAMCTIYKNKGSEIDLQLALEYATHALESCNNHQGILQTYADTVAYTLEQGYSISDQILEKAIRCVNEAIVIDSKYPKYYCTIGRLSIYKNEYTQAKQFILKAIDLEDSKQSDYAMRIADYQNYLQRCYIKESVYKIDMSVKDALQQISDTQSEVREQMEKEKLTHLEFLGFFTAIISFILSTIQISLNFEVVEATTLIMILLGVIIISMIVFSILMGVKKVQGWKIIFLFLIGIFLIAVGNIVAFLYKIGILEKIIQ